MSESGKAAARGRAAEGGGRREGGLSAFAALHGVAAVFRLHFGPLTFLPVDWILNALPVLWATAARSEHPARGTEAVGGWNAW